MELIIWSQNYKLTIQFPFEWNELKENDRLIEELLKKVVKRKHNHDQEIRMILIISLIS